jgi:hypothetical protein
MNYKINNIEVSEDSIRELIRENPELLEKKEGIEYGTRYWVINSEGRKISLYYMNTASDEKHLAFGNVYPVEKECDEAIERRKAVVRLWKYANEKMKFVPDWSDFVKIKYRVYYDFSGYHFSIDCNGSDKKQTELPYLKSIEDAEQFIKDNKADLLLVFGVK